MAKRTPRIMMLLTVLALLRAGFSIGPATAQNEIGEGQKIARNQPNVVSEIMETAAVGEQRLSLADTSGIEGGKEGRLVLRSVDGEVQQAACLARVKDRDVRQASNDSRTQWPWVKIEQPLDIRLVKNDLVLQGESMFVPGQGEGVVARSRRPADEGAEVIAVDDVSKIDPWKKVLIRSEDGDHQEIRCVRTVIGAQGASRDNRDDVAPYFSIIGELEHDFAEGAEIFQGGEEGTGEGVVAKLTASAADGSSNPTLDSLENLDPFKDVLIRSRDGSKQEVHCIKSIDGDNNRVVFTQDLAADFAVGAEVVQGSAVRTALISDSAKNRTKGCDCCGPGGAALWWLASLAVVPFLDDDPPPRDEPPPALSPVTP